MRRWKTSTVKVDGGRFLPWHHLNAMRKTLRCAAKFIIAFFVMTIVCTIAWEGFVDNHLYNCTDGGFFDYLSSGDWVHKWEGHPIKVVPNVVLDRDMSNPDTIQESWTVTRLWYLWYSFFTTSVVISAVLVFVPWIPRRTIRHD
jgi:hypothetical protein